jgi:hypothetical protein
MRISSQHRARQREGEKGEENLFASASELEARSSSAGT